MCMEFEVKFADVNIDEVRRILQRLGSKGRGRVFERNIVFDDANGTLKSRDVLLRLRDAGRNKLTVKVPPEEHVREKVKAYRELESEVADFEMVQKMLAVLGFRPAFSYEKVRETWHLGKCKICLDILPFGTFMEIEGPESDIYPCAEKLGFEKSRGLTENYHQLNKIYRKAKGLSPDDNFVFTAEQRAALKRTLEE